MNGIFRPIEILFVDREAELANSGQISRGSLPAIWEWITKSLLPTMAEEYCGEMKTLLVMDKAREARRIAAEFQCKVAKCLESTLASEELLERTRVVLAQYTASRGAIDDLKKIVSALLIADAIVAFNQALPASIDNLDASTLAAVRAPLDAFAAKYPHAVPFALTIVAKHLKTLSSFRASPPASITFSNRANVIRTRLRMECWRTCGACWGLATGRRIANGLPSDVELVRVRKMRQANG